MTRRMQIRLLGHLEASVDDRPLELGGAKQRAVLAMLGLEANQMVSADRLVEGLWGEEPPPSAAKMVQNYILRLRKVIAADGAAEIVTRGRAYELQIDRELIDALRFERLVAEASRGGSGGAARQALALYRGEPLADIASEPFAGAEIRRLEALRLTASELAVDADLTAGRHQELLSEIDALLAENPLRERLHAQRMLALYRCGRQADALEAYREARARLVEEIGLEPGPELRRLQAAILRQDPALAVEEGAPEFPSELEAAAAQPLIDHERELRALRRRRREGGLVTLAGAYGMGKTRLAAELAREARRDGASVFYASGLGPAEVALAAIGRAAESRGPALLVLDDADRADAEVRLALFSLREGAAVVLATGVQAAALARLEPREALVLEPLDAEAVAAIAAFYAPPGSEIPVDALLRTSRGVPRRVHAAASEWARRAATERVDALAGRSAAERSQARALESQLAVSVVDLQSTLERIEERPAGTPVVCPFKGLASFDRDDAEYFFGREGLVAELVAYLVGAPLLAVVGPSGSGKSSVVRAGLLPALAGGVLPGSQHWTQAVIRPGAHPARELARLSPRDRGVLVVDQFEELFTACQDERERAEFASALLRLPRVVLAVRADFYGRCAAYPELSRALRDNHVLVGPMNREELRRAIERPARRAGLVVEPELADALLADVEGEPGALPLLSTALLELWGRRDGRRLQLAAYARSGGVQGAVARLAEDAYVALDPGQQAAARRLLLRLSDEDEGGAIVRRRIALAEQDDDIVARLTERRLLTVSEGTVEVAHEALLHEWPRLRGWLDEDTEGRRLQHRLRAAAGAWEADRRDPGVLYRGARLAAALDWAAEHGDELDATERAFLEASRRASGRAQRRLRAGLAGVASLLVLAVIAGFVALDQRNQARERETAADAQRLGAQALASDDLDLALLLARQGVTLSDTVQTRGNLLAALLKSPAAIGVIRGVGQPESLVLSPDGRTLVTTAISRSFDFVDARTGRTTVRTGGEFDNLWRGAPLVFDRAGSRIALGGDYANVLDLRSGRELARLDTVGWIYSLTFSADQRELVTLHGTPTEGTEVRRFDVDSGAQVGTGRTILVGPVIETEQEAPRVLATRDGRGVVTLIGGQVALRDARTLATLRTFDDALTGHIALSPDDRTLLLGRKDGRDPLRRPRLGRRTARAGPPPGRGPAARLHPRWTHGRQRGSRQPDPAVGRRAADDPGDAHRPLRAHYRAGGQPRRANALQQRARRQDHALGPQWRAPARSSVRAPGRGRQPSAEPGRPVGRGRPLRRHRDRGRARDAADALTARQRRAAGRRRFPARRQAAGDGSPRPRIAVRIRRRGRPRERPDRAAARRTGLATGTERRRPRAADGARAARGGAGPAPGVRPSGRTRALLPAARRNAERGPQRRRPQPRRRDPRGHRNRRRRPDAAPLVPDRVRHDRGAAAVLARRASACGRQPRGLGALLVDPDVEADISQARRPPRLRALALDQPGRKHAGLGRNRRHAPPL